MNMRIEGYSFGRVLVDGEEHTKDVIVLPNRVVGGWWRRDGHSLVLEDLEEVLDELPERLILGTGAYGRMQPDSGRARAAPGAGDRGREPADAGRGRTLRRARPREDRSGPPPHLLSLLARTVALRRPRRFSTNRPGAWTFGSSTGRRQAGSSAP